MCKYQLLTYPLPLARFDIECSVHVCTNVPSDTLHFSQIDEQGSV